MLSKQSIFDPLSEVAEFEQHFAAFVGAPCALATCSGTAALHLALIGLDIGRGDTVLLPVTTFISPANAVLYTGARIELADVDPDTWCLPSQALFASKANMAIAVHLYGVPCEMGEFIGQGKLVIEDCAEAVGATYADQHVGTYGVAGAFSFNLNKTLTTGGGGALIGGKWFPLDYVRDIGCQAKDIDETHFAIGHNYRMNTAGAVRGANEFELLKLRLARQRNINGWYRDYLCDLVEFQQCKPYSNPSWWYTACLLPDGVDPGRMRDEINASVPTYERPARRVFRPLSDSRYLKVDGDFPIGRRLWERGLCLPSSHLLAEPDVMKVCEIVRRHCGR